MYKDRHDQLTEHMWCIMGLTQLSLHWYLLQFCNLNFLTYLVCFASSFSFFFSWYSMLSQDSINYDHIFKIILVGDNGVGKSSIIRRFCEGTYTTGMDTTIGVDFYLSDIDVKGKKIKVRLAWAIMINVIMVVMPWWVELQRHFHLKKRQFSSNLFLYFLHQVNSVSFKISLLGIFLLCLQVHVCLLFVQVVSIVFKVDYILIW